MGPAGRAPRLPLNPSDPLPASAPLRGCGARAACGGVTRVWVFVGFFPAAQNGGPSRSGGWSGRVPLSLPRGRGCYNFVIRRLPDATGSDFAARPPYSWPPALTAIRDRLPPAKVTKARATAGRNSSAPPRLAGPRGGRPASPCRDPGPPERGRRHHRGEPERETTTELSRRHLFAREMAAERTPGGPLGGLGRIRYPARRLLAPAFPGPAALPAPVVQPGAGLVPSVLKSGRRHSARHCVATQLRPCPPSTTLDGVEGG